MMTPARQRYRTHRDRKRNEARRELRKFVDGRGKARATASKLRAEKKRRAAARGSRVVIDDPRAGAAVKAGT